MGIERPASSLVHMAVFGRTAFLRGSFLLASLSRALVLGTQSPIALCFSCLGLVGSGFLVAFLDKQCLNALQGVNHGSRGFGDCAMCHAVLVSPRRWE